jgi:hypothetical protein
MRVLFLLASFVQFSDSTDFASLVLALESDRQNFSCWQNHVVHNYGR